MGKAGELVPKEAECSVTGDLDPPVEVDSRTPAFCNTDFLVLLDKPGADQSSASCPKSLQSLALSSPRLSISPLALLTLPSFE